MDDMDSTATESLTTESPAGKALGTIYLGGGCFWCTEAVFSGLKGVESVVSGYAGGHTLNPTYDDICSSDTGHAEVIQVRYDEQQISTATLLKIFFATHDPTTLNRQGNDIGTQYRSVIFYTTPEQQACAEQIMAELRSSGVTPVTQLKPAPVFYPAEAYHQQFYARNPFQGYCNAVIPPKLNKLRLYFSECLSASQH